MNTELARKILGVEPGATSKQLFDALKRARKNHPKSQEAYDYLIKNFSAATEPTTRAHRKTRPSQRSTTASETEFSEATLRSAEMNDLLARTILRVSESATTAQIDEARRQTDSEPALYGNRFVARHARDAVAFLSGETTRSRENTEKVLLELSCAVLRVYVNATGAELSDAVNAAWQHTPLKGNPRAIALLKAAQAGIQNASTNLKAEVLADTTIPRKASSNVRTVSTTVRNSDTNNDLSKSLRQSAPSKALKQRHELEAFRTHVSEPRTKGKSADTRAPRFLEKVDYLTVAGGVAVLVALFVVGVPTFNFVTACRTEGDEFLKRREHVVFKLCPGDAVKFTSGQHPAVSIQAILEDGLSEPLTIHQPGHCENAQRDWFNTSDAVLCYQAPYRTWYLSMYDHQSVADKFPEGLEVSVQRFACDQTTLLGGC